MNWATILLIAIALVVGDVNSLSLDPVASTELEQCMKQGDCVISMRHIRPRRKLHISIEALFMIDFPTLKRKMSFFLDRKQQRVTLDITSNGATTSSHFDTPQISETTTIRSLALYFQKDHIGLLVDCKKGALHELNVDVSKLYMEKEEPIIKLFRERKYPLHFDRNFDVALQRGNCQKDDLPQRGNRHMLKNQISEKERNSKREVRNWYNQEPGIQEPAVSRQLEVERGDIPIVHGDCEDALTKSLSDLMALVKLLREDIGQQRQEIAYLRSLLENCAGCKEPPARSMMLEKTCRTSNSCYPGVECHDSLTGPRCGRCPAGMIGDGMLCKPGVTCADRPCFIGVQCRDSLNGAHCDSCPIGYEGDGRSCKLRNSGTIILPSHNIQHYQRQYTARKYSMVTS